MSVIYFGLSSKGRKGGVLSVPEAGGLEPAKPSDVKVFTSKGSFLPFWSLMWSLLGLLVSITSFPRYVYAPFSTVGMFPDPPSSYLPLTLPGLAIPIKKGKESSAGLTKLMQDYHCSSMSFMGRTVWLASSGSKELYLAIQAYSEVDESGASPERYVNPAAFRSVLTIVAYATTICSYFHFLTTVSGGDKNEEQAEVSELDGWMPVSEYIANRSIPVVDSEKVDPKFTESKTFLHPACEQGLRAVMKTACSNEGVTALNSGVVMNALNHRYSSFIRSGDSSSITDPGFIFKYNEKLANPDVNLVTDILGRHFLAMLGDSDDVQFEELAILKSGFGTCRTSAIGSELTHLFKCLEIAIHSDMGLVPFFTGSVYEGCVMMGGTSQTSLFIDGKVHEVWEENLMKQAFLTISDHVSALNFILNIIAGGKVVVESDRPNCMYSLRRMCLQAKVTVQEQKDILNRASLLNFQEKSWAITAHSIAKFSRLVNNLDQLDSSYPISRLSLFEKDMLQVAMGCFGETTCPSWDIPGGTKCSWNRANPPVPTVSVKGLSGKSSGRSDAAWSMNIRKTDLFSAVADFQRAAQTMSYTSVSTVEARKSGYVVVGREKMVEFWKDIRLALKVINPSVQLEGVDLAGVKRAAEETPDTLAGTPPGGVPGKRARF